MVVLVSCQMLWQSRRNWMVRQRRRTMRYASWRNASGDGRRDWSMLQLCGFSSALTSGVRLGMVAELGVHTVF